MESRMSAESQMSVTHEAGRLKDGFAPVVPMFIVEEIVQTETPSNPGRCRLLGGNLFEIISAEDHSEN
jgi:hypothetical protein